MSNPIEIKWDEKKDLFQIMYRDTSLFIDGDEFEKLLHQMNFLSVRRESIYMDSGYTEDGGEPEQFADTEEEEWKDDFNTLKEDFE